MSLETLLARLEAESVTSVTSVTSRQSADVTDLLFINQLSNAGNVSNVEKSVKLRQESKSEAANDPTSTITSWGWRIVGQDGTVVEAYFSPVVTREEALRLTPGATDAVPIPEQNLTTTRVDIPADLKHLINAMGAFWNYSSDDYETAFDGARSDPDAWRAMCLEDSKRFGWELPKVLSPGEIEQAITEATEERRAILEHEAKLRAEQTDAITRLAADFYRHLFGVAYETQCCKPRCNQYCADGLRLRGAYYEAAS